MKRRGGQATLESVIEKVYPSREGYAEVRAHRAFARAMPEPLARRAMPTRVHRGILYVNAETAAWAQEFQMMAPRLLDAMKRADPALTIGSLRFRAGPVERREPTLAPAPPIAKEPVEITAPLAAAIASIRDDAVRAIVLETVRVAAESSGGAGRRRE